MWRPHDRTVSEEANYKIHKSNVNKDGTFDKYQIRFPRRDHHLRKVNYDWDYDTAMEVTGAGHYVGERTPTVAPFSAEENRRIEDRISQSNEIRSVSEVKTENTGSNDNQNLSSEQSDQLRQNGSDDVENIDDLASNQNQNQNENSSSNVNNQINNNNKNNLDLNNLDSDLTTGNIIHTDSGNDDNKSIDSQIENTGNRSNKIPFDQLIEDDSIHDFDESQTPANKRRRKLTQSNNNQIPIDPRLSKSKQKNKSKILNKQNRDRCE